MNMDECLTKFTVLFFKTEAAALAFVAVMLNAPISCDRITFVCIDRYRFGCAFHILLGARLLAPVQS